MSESRRDEENAEKMGELFDALSIVWPQFWSPSYKTFDATAKKVQDVLRKKGLELRIERIIQ